MVVLFTKAGKERGVGAGVFCWFVVVVVGFLVSLLDFVYWMEWKISLFCSQKFEIPI